MDWIRNPGGGTNRRPLLKRDIEEAQRRSMSAAGAARWIGVSYTTYKKYARLYDLHDHHLNPGGKGIPKPHVQGKRYPLEDILGGKHPNYDTRKLKKRLINGGLIDEQCAMCGMKERRILDFKTPLMLVFKDGNSTNHILDNMYLLCFNCTFLTVGELNNLNPYRVNQLSKPDNEAYKGEDMMALSEQDLERALAEAQAELGAELTDEDLSDEI